MKTLINFAHPLSEAAREQIAVRVGNFTEVHRPPQFDLSLPLAGQVEDLAVGADVQHADLVIPPALSAAATLLPRHFKPGNTPRIVWLKREDGIMPPRFVLGGIE